MRSRERIAAPAPSWRRPTDVCSFPRMTRAPLAKSFPNGGEARLRSFGYGTRGDARMRGEQVTYGLAGKKYDGALVYDETIARPRPALLMCPNWMGVRQQAFDRAALLAHDRYIVFVADMYGAGVRPKDFGEAAALATPLRDDPAEARRRVRAAYDAFIRLGQQRGLIDDRRAAIGFCFGGGDVLELARAGARPEGRGVDPKRSQDQGAGPPGRHQGGAADHPRHVRSGGPEGRSGRIRGRNGCRRRKMGDAAVQRHPACLY